MAVDREDTMLDACLAEVLGGAAPPDLSGTILAAYERAVREGTLREGASPMADGDVPGVVAPPPVVVPLKGGVPVVTPSRRTKHRRTTTLQWLSLAAGVVGLGVGIGGIGLYLSQDGPAVPVASQGSSGAGNGATEVASGAASPGTVGNHAKPDSLVVKPKEAGSRGSASKSPSRGPDDIEIASVPDLGSAAAEEAAKAAIEERKLEEMSAKLRGNPLAFTNGQREEDRDLVVVSFIDEQLSGGWKLQGIAPSPKATDGEWCRRLYLRMLGRIPSAEEAKAFVENRSPFKRQALISTLQTDAKYLPEYAKHWSRVWANILIGRTVGTSPNDSVSRAGLESYLEEAFLKNRPYNEIVYDLLTATGASHPGKERFNGAVNFLLAGAENDASIATDRSARVFLGHQLQCAQCHAHPWQDWSQHKFWSLNAFFRQMQVKNRGADAELVDVDFVDRPGVTKSGEIYFQQLSGEMKVAEPTFLDGTKISASGRLQDVNRRAELAKLVTNSEEFSQATVNRLWAHFFGYGFTQPVDDMGPHNSPSYPELLRGVAVNFAEAKYDLRRLTRWIVESDAFALSSQIRPGNESDTPEIGSTARFSRYYTRQMQAEEVFDSLVSAAKLGRSGASTSNLEKSRREWLAQFSQNMATDDGSETSQFDGSVRQSTVMLNGELMRRAVSSQDEGFLKSVVQSELPVEAKIEHLFLASLSRKPTAREMEAAKTVLAGGNLAPSAFEDVWWALLNSNEFILDH